MSEALKWVAFSCTHVPLHDKDSYKRLLARLKEYRPDFVIHLGDGLEASPASRHPNEDDWTLTQEFNGLSDYLGSIREVCGPDADYTYLEGNHCANIQGMGRINKRLRDRCNPYTDRVLGPELAQWRTVPYSHRQVFRLGPVTFRHGAEHGVNADRDQAILYGVEHGLTVGGHTHRGFDVREAMLTNRLPLRFYYMNAGTLADWNRLDYMERRSIAMWTHGLCVGTVSASAVKQNRARFSSPQWDARYELWARGDGA